MIQANDQDAISQVAEQFTRAFWRMRRGTAKELVPFGLTFSQARVLRVLGRADGPVRIGDLAAKLEIVPRSATSMVDTLEEAGLAARQADPSDRRSVLVSLTPAGRTLLERLGEARRASAEALFGRLDEEQLAAMRELLNVLNTPEAADENGAS
ncbi:MAG TPA: MarR family transcriptional regulator [Coriobacteriia bacterium]